MISIIDFITKFWKAELPWNVALILQLYPKLDAGLVQKLWDWCVEQTTKDPAITNDQLIALFQSTMHIVNTSMGYDVLAGTPVPDQPSVEVGKMGRDQFFADLYAYMHSRVPTLYP